MRRAKFIGCTGTPSHSSSTGRPDRKAPAALHLRRVPCCSTASAIQALLRALGRTMRRIHELPFGAELVAGGVRFRLWAPRASTVSLQLGAGSQIPMDAEPGGWFSLT